jgi:hypothetical protein
MQRKMIQQIATVAMIATLFAGCSYGPPMGDVRGNVTVNGQPLEEGSIRFIPVDGETQTTGGIITNGSFQVEVPVAKQRVEIMANVIDQDKTPPNPTDDQIVMKALVPKRYNFESELMLDVVPGLNEPVYNLSNP